MLADADEALRAGLHVAGYLAYEAAAAFGLSVHAAEAGGPPLVWLGVFEAPETIEAPVTQPGPRRRPWSRWQPLLDEAGYRRALQRIQERIARGDTYQVNFTWPLEARLLEEPWDFFTRLFAVQPAPHAAFLDLGRFAVASLSPELFFAREGEQPQDAAHEGHGPRGLDLEDDARAGEALRASAKDRAENLMIVDMLRNDLGRVAETGSVAVPGLFEIERYPTLLQMTSSVVGPKPRALLRGDGGPLPLRVGHGRAQGEDDGDHRRAGSAARGIYTGAIGWAGKGRATLQRGHPHRGGRPRPPPPPVRRGQRRRGRFACPRPSTRSACSRPASSRRRRSPSSRPWPSLPGSGYRRLEGHLARLRASASYFGVALGGEVEEALRDLAGSHRRAQPGSPPRRSPGTRPARDLAPATRTLAGPRGARRGSGGRESPWLRHKTTRREVYDRALRARPDCDDVLLWNQRGEVTEAALANVAFDLGGGALVTPPLACGLLPGVERAALLARGPAARGGHPPEPTSKPGQRLWLLNSVRGLFEATFAG